MATIDSPYCTESDLLIEETVRKLPTALVKQDYILAASREISGKLGLKYAIPLTLSSAYVDQYGTPLSDFPQNEKDLIKDICVKLASGRILLQIASDSDDAWSRYGSDLVKEAQYFLTLLASGEVSLSANGSVGAEKGGGNSPAIQNRDAMSMVEAFEDRFMRPIPPVPPLVPPAIYPGPEA